MRTPTDLKGKTINQLVKEFQVAHKLGDAREVSTVDFIFSSVGSIILNHRMNVFSRFFLIRKVRMLKKHVLNTITTMDEIVEKDEWLNNGGEG